MSGKRRLTSVGLALLFGGASACSQQQPKASGVDFNAQGFEGFDETQLNLLAAECAIDGTTGAMTLTMGADETALLYKRSSDGMVVANAPRTGGECAVAATKKINITGTAAGATNQKVIIDFYTGAFGLATAASGSGATAIPASGPNIIIDLGAQSAAEGSQGDWVKIRGTSYAETYTFGTATSGTSYAGFTIGTSTARPLADMSLTGVENVVVSTGPGNDIVTGQGGSALGVGTQGTSVISTGAGVYAAALSGAISFVVYGGEGNDTLTSGATSDANVHNYLNGGAGNDLFPQPAATRGSDQIIGGEDTDTVDYSARTTAVRVAANAATPVKATGSLTLVAPSAIHDNDQIVISDGPVTKTIEYRKTPDAAAATGSITCVAKENMTDYDYITITDAAATPKTITLEFQVTATGAGDPAFVFEAAQPGSIVVDVSGAADADAVAALVQGALAVAIADVDAPLSMTAPAPEAGTPIIVLTNSDNGVGVAIVDGMNHAGGKGFTITGMTGGGLFATPAAGAIVIDVTDIGNAGAKPMATAANVAAATYSAIAALHSTLAVTATVPPAAVVALTCNVGGTTGCGAFTVTQTGAFTVSGMTGGAADIVYDDGAWDGTATTEGDQIDGTVENILGSAYNDIIDASAANVVHVLMGMDGNDTLTGGPMADYIYGGKGNDTLKGGGGIDYLIGGDGDDTLQGGAGNDQINGGGVNCLAAASTTAPVSPFFPALCTTAAAPSSSIGINTIDFSDRYSTVHLDLTTLASCTATTPVYVGEVSATECDVIASTGTGATLVLSVRNIKGGAGADTLIGDAQDNTIWGGEGVDTISGGLGNDSLYGEGGDDIINGGPDAPALTGTQTDTDYVCGGPGSNTLNGNLGLNTVDSTQGWGDTVNCGASDGNIWLSSGSHGETGTNCQL